MKVREIVSVEAVAAFVNLIEIIVVWPGGTDQYSRAGRDQAILT